MYEKNSSTITSFISFKYNPPYSSYCIVILIRKSRHEFNDKVLMFQIYMWNTMLDHSRVVCPPTKEFIPFQQSPNSQELLTIVTKQWQIAIGPQKLSRGVANTLKTRLSTTKRSRLFSHIFLEKLFTHQTGRRFSTVFAPAAALQDSMACCSTWAEEKIDVWTTKHYYRYQSSLCNDV